MPKFKVEETVPCWVTYSAVVEANSAEEAETIFKDGVETTTLFGDVIDCLDVTLEVTEIPTSPDQEN